MENCEDIGKKIEEKVEKWCCNPMKSNDSCGGFMYILGIIGAAVYYIQVADSFGAGVIGF